MKNLFLIVALILGFKTLSAQRVNKQSVITVRALSIQVLKNDSSTIKAISYENKEISKIKYLAKKNNKDTLVWSLPANEPYYFFFKISPKSKSIEFVAEPGDDILLTFKAGVVAFSGKGSNKLVLIDKLQRIADSLKFMVTTKDVYLIKSLNEYLEWQKYLNAVTKQSLSMITSYKTRITEYGATAIKNEILSGIAEDRFISFRVLKELANKGWPRSDLNRIYDSIQSVNMSSTQLPSLSGTFFGSWYFIQDRVYRPYGFDFKAAQLNSKPKRHLLYYNEGCKVYSGLALEKFKVYMLTSQMIDEDGLIPQTDSLLARYYSEPGYPQYKAFVKQKENFARKLVAGRASPNFELTNEKGASLYKSNFAGKVVLIDFWFTGCVGCLQMTPALKKVEEHFKNDSNIVFLSVSIDKSKDQWMGSIVERKYTTGTSINLYTGGQGANHPIIKDFQVDGYPNLYLIDAQGNIVVNPVPDPRSGREMELISLLEKQLVLIKDGPYVFKDANKVEAFWFNGNIIGKNQSVNGDMTLMVATDQYRQSFDLRLQTNKQPEPSEFPAPEKLIAFSDIEGNFDAFRKLLQSNGVINKAMDWIFGNGHLVFAGDMFDRGQQVTECLWLIYSLEEKAKAKGGYVHFVLGNHEVMNLNGKIQYVKPKYIKNARLIGKSYVDLYRENSELGQWLRTKNIVEKVGPLLFTHGGISPEFIELSLPLNKINEIARPFYAKDTLASKSSDKYLATIFNSKKGPFWYRDYYMGNPVKVYTDGSKEYRTSDVTIDRTLEFYKVRHIVTGHTIIDAGEHVSLHFDRKVINTDTEHSKGKSEALLVEGNSYYRVNDKGQRWLLFKDEADVKSLPVQKNNK